MLVNNIAFKRSSVKSEVSDCPRRSLRLKFELCSWRALHPIQNNRKTGYIQASVDKLVTHLVLSMPTKFISTDYSWILKGQHIIFNKIRFLWGFTAMNVSWWIQSRCLRLISPKLIKMSRECTECSRNLKVYESSSGIFIWPESYIVPGLSFWW